MAKKAAGKLPKRKGEFAYRGSSLEELKKISLEEFAKLVPARQRRTLRHGFSDDHKKLLARLRKGEKVRTHLRDMIVVPDMIGKTVSINAGKEWNLVEIIPEMLGHYLGEFALTRKRVSHGAAGIGATKSSKYIPLK